MKGYRITGTYVNLPDSMRHDTYMANSKKEAKSFLDSLLDALGLSSIKRTLQLEEIKHGK